VSKCVKANQVAITFDDGPYIYDSDLLDQFAAVGAKTTLFVNGNNWDCIYNHADSLQRAYKNGHQIASHTWSHADITTLSASAFTTELKKLEEAIGKILGVTPTYFRPPYGNYNQAALNTLTSNNYRYAVLWDIDSGDSDGYSVSQSTAAISNAFASTGNNYHIILNHDTYGNTISGIVPWLLNFIKSKGLQAVTVAECLGDSYSPYRPYGSGQLGVPDSTWTC